MLLEFRLSNYKSFIDETVFSLVPINKQRDLNYSIIEEKTKDGRHRGLCSSVIYGPNASGKTNIIGAMEVFKSIILRGNIKNYEGIDTSNFANMALARLELIPNVGLEEIKPVSFGIKFISHSLLIDYRLSFDAGYFLDRNYSRKVILEELSVEDEVIFTRTDSLNVFIPKFISDWFGETAADNAEVLKLLANENLKSDELFLTNGFKNMFSSRLVSVITDWIENKFIVIYRYNLTNVVASIKNLKDHQIYIDSKLTEAVKEFGASSDGIGYAHEEENSENELYSIVTGKNGHGYIIPSDVYESYGTLRFANVFPLIEKILIDGGTLVADEFDASLHPMAVMNLISIFHNDEINKNHAQLVFNTHNPIFLNKNLYRRDEIKFVERDGETNGSILYSLSDFGTAGKSGVRNTDDYMKNYFVSRYGAIKDADFSSLISKAINNSVQKGTEAIGGEDQ